MIYIYRIENNQFSCSVVSDSLRHHGLEHARPPCPSPTPRACSNTCPLSQWCHPTISTSNFPFSSCLQSFPESGSFQTSQFFTSGGQSTGASASASVLPVNIQGWFPLGLTGWISLQSKDKQVLFLLVPLRNNCDSWSFTFVTSNIFFFLPYKLLTNSVPISCTSW